MMTISNYNAGAAAQSSGGTTGVSSLQEGPGILIQNPNGPTATIANGGVISLVAGQDMEVQDMLDGSWTVSADPVSPWELPNSITTQDLVLSSYLTNQQYNPAVQEGWQGIVATGADDANLILTTQTANIHSAVAIGTSGVIMSAGGSGNAPTGLVSVIADGNIVISNESADNSRVNLRTQVFQNNSIQNNVYGACEFINQVPECSAVMPDIEDNSTKIPSTAWVQSFYLANSPKTITVKYQSDGQEITMPAGVQAVDLIAISGGGQCGSKSQDTLRYGGSGAGGTTCICIKMLTREGRKFKYDYSTTFLRVSYTQPSDDSFVTLCDIPPGGNGEDNNNNGTGGGGGQPGGAPGLDSTYGTWTTLYGTAGKNTYINPFAPPTTAGAPKGRPYVSDEPGCGQRQPTGGSWGRPVLYITYYYT